MSVLIKPLSIGSYVLDSNLFLAPMAGVTDRAFRTMCRQLGASYAVSEMVLAKAQFQTSIKTTTRINHIGEESPIAVQIVGTEPEEMAQAALFNIQHGAQIIDINMGCPAKKVCKKLSGSALMKDEKLAISIIEAVVKACEPLNVPVTLKIRTGWSEETKNALVIARHAENSGIAMLTVHGRTREQAYKGLAEYDTIAEIKQSVKIPVVANGDIDSPQKAKFVLQKTGADALMIGRAAQKRPWIFREIALYLTTGQIPAPPESVDIYSWVARFLHQHHNIHGESTALRSARKYIHWLTMNMPEGKSLCQKFNQAQNFDEQLEIIQDGLLNLSYISKKNQKCLIHS